MFRQLSKRGSVRQLKTQHSKLKSLPPVFFAFLLLPFAFDVDVAISPSEMSARVPIDRQQIADFCRRHHIRKLALFGSVLRDDFRPESDVDVLVEFEPDHVPGLAFFAMQRELSELLRRRVDLSTPGFLSRYFRDQVIAESEALYVRP